MFINDNVSEQMFDLIEESIDRITSRFYWAIVKQITTVDEALMLCYIVKREDWDIDYSWNMNYSDLSKIIALLKYKLNSICWWRAYGIKDEVVADEDYLKSQGINKREFDGEKALAKAKELEEIIREVELQAEFIKAVTFDGGNFYLFDSILEKKVELIQAIDEIWEEEANKTKGHLNKIDVANAEERIKKLCLEQIDLF